MAWESGAQPVVLLTKTDLVDDVDAVPRRGRDGHARRVPDRRRLGTDRRGARRAARAGSRATAPPSCSARRASASRRSSTRSSARSCSRRRRCARTTSVAGTRRAHRELILLPSGGVVLDTPGIRELQLWDADLEQTFGDVEEIARRCRFSDCAHDQEPGCAIREALADGSLAARPLGRATSSCSASSRRSSCAATTCCDRNACGSTRFAHGRTDPRRSAEPAPRPRGRGRVRAARSRAPLRRGGARAGGHASATRPAVRLGRRRLAARASRGRTPTGSSTCSASTALRARPRQPAARRRPVRRQVGASSGRSTQLPAWLDSIADAGPVEHGRAALPPARRPRRTCCSTRRRSRPADDAPLIVVHDGPEYAEYAGLTRFLDAMSWEERIPPLRAALIQPVDRNETYSASALYAGALVRELLPRDRRARAARQAHRHGGESRRARDAARARPPPEAASTASSSSRAASSASAPTSRSRASAATSASRGSSAPCSRGAAASGRSRSPSPAAPPRRTAPTTSAIADGARRAGLPGVARRDSRRAHLDVLARRASTRICRR